MDDTLRRLEFNKIRDMLSAETAFSGGRSKVQALQPSPDFAEVQIRQAETRETLELMNRGDASFLFELTDIRASLKRALAQGILMPAELYEVCRILRAARLAEHFMAPGSGQSVTTLRNRLTVNQSLEKTITDAVDESGDVKDGASSELRSIRTRMATLKARIRDYLRDYIRSSQYQKYLQESIVTERSGRYVVPVKQEHRNDVPGIVHDESASGATVFIEPEVVVRSNNEIRKLEIEEKREIERILRQLTGAVSAFAEELEEDLSVLEILDFWIAKGRLAIKLEAYEPILNREGRIRLYKARHPMLGKRAIPIDFELGRGFDILVITGPNTGGKTVGLKTVGLLTLMAMSGLFIPASYDSEISVFEEMLCDIGDEQSIEQSLSTFSAHMTNIIQILHSAGPRSLVILDELGAGTDPLEGAALGRAILEKLLQSGSRVLVSTHHSELKAFAYQNQRVENACVEFDPVSLRPTYRLTIGLPGQSNAFEIAANLGMDEQIVSRAREHVPEQEIETAQMLKELKEMRFSLESERDTLRLQKAEMEKEKKQYQEERMKNQQEQEQILRQLRDQADRYLKDVRLEAEEIIEEMKERARESETPKWHEIEQMRAKFRDAVPAARQKEPKPAEEKTDIHKKLMPGDYVVIKNIGQRGYILEAPSSSGEVTVQVGIMKFTVKVKDVKAAASPDENASRQRNRSYLEKRQNAVSEISLRGMLADEALAEAERYIEDAYLGGMEKVRIIHGKGTGALRKAIRDFLAHHPYVEKYREGEPNEGGQGVTIAYLKNR